LLLVAPPALAGEAVAVMPFSDLAGAQRNVGEAIRETVTTDLREVPGLTVVERARLDAVLTEQRLASAGELDPARAAKVGRLVGASLIVTGAYQRSGGSVRLTARFVRVETGEVVGAAKVDGAAGDFLALQDRVTGELARSAGFKIAPKRRPRLRSLRAVEKYGDSLLANDDRRRQELLRAAVAEEPEFEYAVRDLDALERRMRDLVARADRERERAGLARVEPLALRAHRAKGEEAVAAWEALFDELHDQLRFRRLLDEAEFAVRQPPLARAAPGGARLDERARFELILALAIFKRDADRLLREGERFLADHPTSRRFDEVKRFMDYAIRWKRKAAAGAGNAAARIEALPPAQRADPCTVGHVYHEERQLSDAAATYEKCVADPRSHQNNLMNLINVYIAIPDFRSARRALELLRTRYPGVAEGPQGQGWREIPIDAD
jgi:TolB-like protein